jgi:hypothetical protein
LRIWKFAEHNFDKYEKGLLDCIEYTNDSDFRDLLFGGGMGGPKVCKFPVVCVNMTHPTFAPDYFSFDSLTFVSEKMRRLLDVNPKKISYFDVETGTSSSIFQAMGYKTMFNRATERVVDLEKSVYSEVEIPAAFQGLGFSGRDYDSFAFKEDIKICSHLFTDAALCTPWEFCTDVQAMKLLRAGCTGFRCWDTRQLKLFREPRKFRTLQGLAEEGPWDPIK